MSTWDNYVQSEDKFGRIRHLTGVLLGDATPVKLDPHITN